MTDRVTITGVGLAVPGLRQVDELLLDASLSSDVTVDPAARLGRRGLAYKDEATRLALCAVHEALGDAGLPSARLQDDTPVGVVVSSNFGNLDTVCRTVDTIHSGSASDLSPMDVPNASSNVIASTIAIRYGCRGVNLMLCSGATSGVDALVAAVRALRAGRAARVIVAGVEPMNAIVTRLAAASAAPDGLRLGGGAASVVLEWADDARRRGARIRGTIEGYDEVDDGLALAAALRPGDLWLLPNQAWPCARAAAARLRRSLQPGVEARDLSRVVGEVCGALGVIQCAAACVWLADGSGARADRRALITAGGSWGDATASLLVGAPCV
jgi:3-oxoacyl-[acyl-carrier-protein] synthase II